MIGRVLGNRYEIIEKIGGGGMAIVYKARCRVLNRFVAIKVLRDELTNDHEFVEKFKQESLSAASLAHPNIVNIYDTGIDGDIYYIVMEYVKGENLKKYISKRGRLSEHETIRIARQIAEGLKHAHTNNIIHRDIKPHNILITEDGIAKVTDFGIARAATSSTINNTSNVIGSVHYFSPEQARGGYVDEKSDIYSLGIVMYEMITGVVPFDADNHISVAMKQIQEKPVPPSKKIKNLQISKGLEEIIMKCLEKHQSFRFQSVDELIKKLDLLSGNGVASATQYDEALTDSPTIIMPPLNDLANEQQEINIDLIDENQDNAFKSFFSGDSEDKEKINNNEENKENNKGNKKITILAILSALAVAVIGGAIALKAIMYVPEVDVPNLLGRSEKQAQEITKDLGLDFVVKERKYSNEYDEGEVMDQSVKEGSKVKENYPIEVTISKGIKEIIVPNLVGRYAIEAGGILSNAGLKEGISTEGNSDTIPAGQIMDQSPKANEPADENDVVNYVISQGPNVKNVPMPSVIGLQVDTARLLIEQKGLTVGDIKEEASDTVEKGFVLRQSVPVGQDVAEGSSIWMTVSSGKKVEETPVEEPGTQEPSQGTYPLTITLPKDKEKVSVVVQKIDDGGREIVYSEEVNTNDQSIIVNLKGTGTQVYEIYIDNELYEKTEIKFE